MSNYNTKNYTEQGGDVTHIGGTLVFEAGATVEGDGAADLSTVATGTTLGGVKAVAKGAGDTVVAKIGPDGKLYVPALPIVGEDVLGGVKASPATASDTVAIAADADGYLFAPAPPTAANQEAVAADATLDALRAAYNDLLMNLKGAGIMEADS